MRIALVFALLNLMPAAEPQRPPVLSAMKAELDRSLTEFRKQPTPPYFLSYEITEMDVHNVAANFGMLTASSSSRSRELDIDLRVGSPQLDNTHIVRGGIENIFDRVAQFSVRMPLDDDAGAIRSLLWYHTDQRYKRALERLSGITTNIRTKAENTDKAGDFSSAPALQAVEAAPAGAKFDAALWEQKVRKYTEPFRRFGNLYVATASLSATLETRWYVNSEGAAIQTVEPRYRLAITATGKADDGMELPRTKTYFSRTPAGLPDDATVLAAVNTMMEELKQLKVAPVQGPYTGPAVLSGRAAGVFFHEIFGHRIEAQRQKDENEQHTFRDQVGKKVLPEFLSVLSDPTRQTLGKTELSGHYRFDNQGVKARPVTVVDKGVLKEFLMSRTPVDQFPQSNGHGRKQPGAAAAARQSNLIVEATNAVSPAALKKQLIEEVNKANLPYGLYFEEVQGGFTNVMRMGTSGFNVIPTMVYRIYPDGREELVRGVDLIGTPLTAFSKIVAADNAPVVFNGTCGAESGLIPVSASSPGLMVAQVEVQRKVKSQETSPILPPPFDDRP